MLRQVDDNAFARCVREDALERHPHHCPLTRQPGVDTGIGVHHLFIAEAVPARHIDQGIVVSGRHLEHVAHEIAIDR